VGLVVCCMFLIGGVFSTVCFRHYVVITFNLFLVLVDWYSTCWMVLFTFVVFAALYGDDLVVWLSGFM